jgi:hypothetical protein
VYGTSSLDAGSKKYLYNFDGKTHCKAAKTGEVEGNVKCYLREIILRTRTSVLAILILRALVADSNQQSKSADTSEIMEETEIRPI